MLPELFRIPFLNLPVHTYGALYVSGLMIGLFVASRQARLGGKYHDDLLDFGFWALLGALLGARVLFIIVESNYYFIEQPFTKFPWIGIEIPTIFALWKGGFVFWGGAVGGMIAMVIFCKKRNIPMDQFADFCALGLPLGHALGRLGCVGGGCCYGYASYHLDHLGHVVADNPFAIAFPPGSIAYSSLYDQASAKTLELMQSLGSTLPLFPVQIFELLCNWAIFFIILCLSPLKRAHGQMALLYLVLYSIMRSIAETLRGDTARGFVIEGILSTSQFISLVMSLFALGMMMFLYKRSQQSILSNT